MHVGEYMVDGTMRSHVKVTTGQKKQQSRFQLAQMDVLLSTKGPQNVFLLRVTLNAIMTFQKKTTRAPLKSAS